MTLTANHMVDPARFNGERLSRPMAASRLGRRGIILVTAIWVIIVLGALLLLFARSMRVEVMAASNRLASQQATGIELGAEEYVLSAIDNCDGDAVSVIQTPAEQLQLGEGYFWILQAEPTDDYDYAFGITDECSKLNINVASDAALATMPGITQDIADSIIDWRDANDSVTGQGAETAYYNTLARPYRSKNSPFETVEELYLVKGVNDSVLFGYDLDHNGMIDSNEQSSAGLASSFNTAQDTGRGIFPFVTAWGTEPNTTSGGKARLNIARLRNTAALSQQLSKVLSTARVNQLLAPLTAQLRLGGSITFRNLFQFALLTRMTSSELGKVYGLLTTSTAKNLPGLVNVNTASEQVLMCLGLTQQDADNLIAQRPTTTASSSTGSSLTSGASSTGSSTSCAWVLDALRGKSIAIGSLITGKSYFYSADIVAVSGNGRAFRRMRIVVDGRSSPPIIIYRKDLTSFGWPLSPDILTALKTNQPLPATTGIGTGGSNGLNSGGNGSGGLGSNGLSSQ